MEHPVYLLKEEIILTKILNTSNSQKDVFQLWHIFKQRRNAGRLFEITKSCVMFWAPVNKAAPPSMCPQKWPDFVLL